MELFLEIQFSLHQEHQIQVLDVCIINLSLLDIISIKEKFFFHQIDNKEQ